MLMDSIRGVAPARENSIIPHAVVNPLSSKSLTSKQLKVKLLG